jgi:hypothetical protein
MNTKYIVLTAIGTVAIILLSLFLFALATYKHDDYYCGYCGAVNDRYYVFDNIMIQGEFSGNRIKYSNWHDGATDHKWIVGSSYGGGGSSSGQYMHLYIHELIDGLPINQRQKFKELAIDFLKNDDGFNSEYTRFIW